jgi:hypothetical protein
MIVEVTHLRMKRFEIGAVDAAQVQDSVPPQSFILSMQPIDSCSRDERACEDCQSEYDRSTHGVSFELFVNLFVHIQLRSRARPIRGAD